MKAAGEGVMRNAKTERMLSYPAQKLSRCCSESQNVSILRVKASVMAARVSACVVGRLPPIEVKS